MKICIDARTINLDKMHGISRCALALLKNIGYLDKENTFFIICRQGKLAELFKRFENYEFYMTNVPPYSVAEQLAVPAILRNAGADLYHVPTYGCPIYQPCPTIVTIHDLIHMKFKQDYGLIHRVYFNFVVKSAARRAARVITDSNVSKNDIIGLLSVDGRNISVIYPGVDEEFSQKLENEKTYGILRKFNIPDKYIMTLGNPKPHKNIKRLVEAYLGSDIVEGLVVVGINRRQIELSGERMNRIIFLPSVTEEELKGLYQCARLFVLPSLYEGFGLPALEAASAGVPVVSSNCKACREVLGDSARFVQPQSAEDIIRGMKETLRNEKLRKELVIRASKRVRAFSWVEAARKTLATYYDVLGFH